MPSVQGLSSAKASAAVIAQALVKGYHVIKPALESNPAYPCYGGYYPPMARVPHKCTEYIRITYRYGSSRGLDFTRGAKAVGLQSPGDAAIGDPSLACPPPMFTGQFSRSLAPGGETGIRNRETVATAETFGNRVRINEPTHEIYARLKQDMQQRAMETGFVRLSGTIVTGSPKGGECRAWRAGWPSRPIRTLCT